MPEDHMRNTYATHYHSCKATGLPSITKSTVFYHCQLLPAPRTGFKEGRGQQTAPPKQLRGDAAPRGSSSQLSAGVLPKPDAAHGRILGLPTPDQHGSLLQHVIGVPGLALLQQRHINKRIFLNLSQQARYEIKTSPNLPNTRAPPLPSLLQTNENCVKINCSAFYRGK